MDITIKTEDLKAASEEIKTVNTDMQSTVTDMKDVIKKVHESWQSEASTTFIARFNKFVEVFDSCKAAIDNYAKFLDETAVAYENADSAINNAAN